jgi:hypothetical protein
MLAGQVTLIQRSQLLDQFGFSEPPDVHVSFLKIPNGVRNVPIYIDQIYFGKVMSTKVNIGSLSGGNL